MTEKTGSIPACSIKNLNNLNSPLCFVDPKILGNHTHIILFNIHQPLVVLKITKMNFIQ